MKYFIFMMIALALSFRTAHALPCDDESKDTERMLSMAEEMQEIVDSPESSPEHFCRGGRLEVSQFFKNAIDEVTSYSECPTIGPAAKRYVGLLKEQQTGLDWYFADVCK